MEPWILIDPNAGAFEFTTEEEALVAATEQIEQCLDEGEWISYVKDIHITRGGVMTHRIVEIDLGIPEEVQEMMEDDPDYQPPYDYYCDYVMRPCGDLSVRPEGGQQ